MDNQTAPEQVPTKNARPIIVIVISWLFLISGIIELLFSGPAFLLAFAGKSLSEIAFATLYFAIAISTVIVSFGISGMKRWGYWGFIVVTVLGVISSILSYLQYGAAGSSFGITAIELVLLAYFWYIREKFV